MTYEKPEVLEICKAKEAILGEKLGLPFEWNGLQGIFNPSSDHVDLALVWNGLDSKSRD
jgi:hypothetical protein